MDNQDKFDRYTILKALYSYLFTLEQQVTSNPLLSEARRKELVQSNNNCIQGIIDRLFLGDE